ncbi:hypothetical protein EalM132_00145 [Exiguobacterium phage vB_EalM-132]|nr:hypothetical protein EalM132_00145 [Exiguobacterium phage vB_EalM-132]
MAKIYTFKPRAVAPVVSQVVPAYSDADPLTRAIEDADRLADNLDITPEEALEMANKMYSKYPSLFDYVRPDNDFTK